MSSVTVAIKPGPSVMDLRTAHFNSHPINFLLKRKREKPLLIFAANGKTITIHITAVEIQREEGICNLAGTTTQNVPVQCRYEGRTRLTIRF